MYDEYVAKFNARDYDGVFDYYVDNPDMSFFVVTPRSREDLKRFYGFLHSYLIETITVDRFVSNDEMIALEAQVRIEGTRDLDAETLAAHGYPGLQPVRAGQVIEMKQYIHYHLDDGKITSVGCAIPF